MAHFESYRKLAHSACYPTVPFMNWRTEYLQQSVTYLLADF